MSNRRKNCTDWFCSKSSNSLNQLSEWRVGAFYIEIWFAFKINGARVRRREYLFPVVPTCVEFTEMVIKWVLLLMRKTSPVFWFFCILQCIITLVLLLIKDVYMLINYVSFVESLFTLISVSGLLWMRYSKPDMHRPIKVSFTNLTALAPSCPCPTPFPLKRGKTKIVW